MQRKLSELLVGRLREPGEIWDTLVPGFGIRIGKRTRTWIVAIRRPGASNPVRLKIGAYPDLSLGEARARAREIMIKGAPADPITVTRMIEEFLGHGTAKRGRPLRQNTVDQYRRLLSRYLAELHARPAHDITRRDVATLFATIARDSGAPTAALVRSTVARMFGWAVQVGYLENNPVAGSPSYSVGKGERVLSDSETRALWHATALPLDYHLIVRLCLWLGLRRGEAGGMRWSEFQGTTWTLPAARSKNRRALVLPLPRQAVQALAQWPIIVGHNHLFGSGRNGFGSWSDAKEQLDARLRFDTPWQLRDIRRTVQTGMASIGIPREIVNQCLNHAMGPIEQAYNRHDYFDEKRAALQKWADHLDRLVSPS